MLKNIARIKGEILMSATNPTRTQPQPQKITTFLWFDNNAEEAANFYVSVFKNSRIVATSHYSDFDPGRKGTVMTIEFELDGQRFTALNSGPTFKFTEAISLVVHCETQQEIDYFWEKLSEGGQKVECGWLKDKFGLAWQIVPNFLLELLTSGDNAKTDRVMRAVMSMKKLDLEDLKKAAGD
jgi:predicted 3-demethylubiquinone-9 3-methyltransferase (glyoxalase superfamily)